MATRNILLTPGPIPIPEEVRRIMAEPIIHHRTPQYRKIFQQATERLKMVFMTKEPIYTITGSGTSAMEAAIVNLHSHQDEVLVVEGGKFGERFTELAHAFGLKPTVIKIPYGDSVDPKAIEEALKKNSKIKSVCIQLCETSTAVLYDIKAIAKITSQSQALLIVDAIAALGADRLETDAWGVDVVVTGSQKALMLPPGLAFISVNARARERVQTSNIPKYYLGLKHFEKAIKDWDTPWTSAITIVIGLNKALEMIEKEGLENVFKRSWDLGVYTRQQLAKMGMQSFSKAPSGTVSAVMVPKGMDGEKIIKVMRDDKGVTMAGGQGEMKGKIIRIAHMGSITRAEIDEGLRILNETLQEQLVKA